MILQLLSHLGSGVLGVMLKVIAAKMQNSHELELEKLRAITRGQDNAQERWSNSDNYTKHSRRLFGLLVVCTYCIVVLLFACFPGYPIVTFLQGVEPDQWSISGFGIPLIGTTAPANLEDRTFVVTTGHFVLGAAHFTEMILAMYFTPIGKR